MHTLRLRKSLEVSHKNIYTQTTKMDPGSCIYVYSIIIKEKEATKLRMTGDMVVVGLEYLGETGRRKVKGGVL